MPADMGKIRSATGLSRLFDTTDPGVALVVEAGHALPLIYAHPRQFSIVLARFNNVDKNLLARVQPDCILFPLFAPTFDAAQMVMLLARLGYKGHACAVSGSLPLPKMVENELRGLARGMTLDLIEYEG